VRLGVAAKLAIDLAEKPLFDLTISRLKLTQKCRNLPRLRPHPGSTFYPGLLLKRETKRPVT
jgi:hypothetical protein